MNRELLRTESRACDVRPRVVQPGFRWRRYPERDGGEKLGGSDHSDPKGCKGMPMIFPATGSAGCSMERMHGALASLLVRSC